MTRAAKTARPGSADLAVSTRLSRTGIVLVLFVLAMLALLVASGWENAVSALSEVGAGGIAALCALAGAHYVLRAIRWHLMVRASGIETRLGRDMRHYFGGFAMTATPGRVGELVRLRWLRRETGRSYDRLVPIAFADRAIELAAIVLLIAATLVASRLGTAAAWWVVAVAGLVVWVACRPRLLAAAIEGLWVLSGRRASRIVARLRRMTRGLDPFMRPRILLPTLAIGIVGWALEGAAFWLLLSWLGAPVGPATATAIFLTAVLSGTLSGLPGGLGGTEATSVALLLLQGVPLETAILATAVIRVTTLWFAVAIGLLVFPVAELRSTSS